MTQKRRGTHFVIDVRRYSDRSTGTARAPIF